MTKRKYEPASVCALALQQCGRFRMSTSYVHELMLVVARLPNRVLANLALPSRVYGYFSVARTPDIVWLPSLYLNNQQAYAGNAHNEIWISVSDQWFVVDNHVIWELLKKRKHFLLASAGAVGKAIWYHFSHVHPRGQSWHAGRAIAETNAAGWQFSSMRRGPHSLAPHNAILPARIRLR